MQVDLNFHENKMKMTDTVRSVSYLTQIDAVESEQGIGQFLRDEPLEEQIEKMESNIVKANIRVNKYKEWTSRITKANPTVTAIGARLETARSEAEGENATEMEKAGPVKIQEELDDLYERLLGGTIDEDGVMNTSIMKEIVDTWEGDDEEKGHVIVYKADLRDLKKDRNIHDKAFGSIFKYLKDTTGV